MVYEINRAGFKSSSEKEDGTGAAIDFSSLILGGFGWEGANGF